MQMKRGAIVVFVLTLGTAVGAIAQSRNQFHPYIQEYATQQSLDTENSVLLEPLTDFRLDSAGAAEANSASSRVATPSAAIVAPVSSVGSTPADIAANPGRPSMATSALLTTIGYAQFENGILYATGSDEFRSRAAMEETMRFTVARRLQFIVSDEPVAYSRSVNNNLTQGGDFTAGVQVVVLKGQGSKPTIAVSYSRLMHGGTATNLDIGSFVNGALLIGSFDLGLFHFDANGFINETGGPVRRAQLGVATAVTHPLGPKLSATVGFRQFTQPLAGGNGSNIFIAAGYSLRPTLVFDVGAARGLNSTSTGWQALCGFTYLLPSKTSWF